MTGTRADIRLGGDQVQETSTMACFRIEHAFIHIDIDDLGAVLHLLPGHIQCLLVIRLQDQFV